MNSSPDLHLHLLQLIWRCATKFLLLICTILCNLPWTVSKLGFKMHKIQNRSGLSPDPTGRAYSAPQTPLLGRKANTLTYNLFPQRLQHSLKCPVFSHEMFVTLMGGNGNEWEQNSVPMHTSIVPISRYRLAWLSVELWRQRCMVAYIGLQICTLSVENAADIKFEALWPDDEFVGTVENSAKKVIGRRWSSRVTFESDSRYRTAAGHCDLSVYDTQYYIECHGVHPA